MAVGRWKRENKYSVPGFPNSHLGMGSAVKTYHRNLFDYEAVPGWRLTADDPDDGELSFVHDGLGASLSIFSLALNPWRPDTGNTVVDVLAAQNEAIGPAMGAPVVRKTPWGHAVRSELEDANGHGCAVYAAIHVHCVVSIYVSARDANVANQLLDGAAVGLLVSQPTGR